MFALLSGLVHSFGEEDSDLVSSSFSELPFDAFSSSAKNERNEGDESQTEIIPK